MPKTNRKAYKDHAYSGPRKSMKRVQAGLKMYHGETSRLVVWRKAKTENTPPNVNISHDESKPQVPQDTPKLKTYERKRLKIGLESIGHDETKSEDKSKIKTYERKRPRIRLEATFSAPSTSTTEPLIEPQPIEINWPQPDPKTENFQMTVEVVPNECLSEISGYRIVDLKHVIQWAFLLERHRNVCESSRIEFVSENRNGFHSDITFKCSMCDKMWKHSTENNNKINTSFVWATVTAGSYYSQAAHITSLMDIPTMASNKFRSIEKELGKVWQSHLTEEIKDAGEKEKSIAIQKGHVAPDGVPYISVYVDGGWLKRSYGHNFDSSSGMACIIGKETKKCLYIGVRNKYCYTCQYYEKKTTDVKPHNCCKNFTGPSTAMESDIIVEGFQKSEELHGVRYLNFIGDGDSSVFANLKEKVSYGQQIKKIECKNHVVKNYTGALYKILANTKLPIHGRNILKPKLSKLTLVARKIIIHSQSGSMAEDLRNGPLHVFGNHEKCKEYYCKSKNTPSDEDKGENLIDNLKKTAPEVWALIYAANERIALKAGRLTNETTNIAENLMSVINKFTCGKRLSLGKGGSYQRRVHVAGLSHATGYKWHVPAWKKKTTQSPGLHFKKYIERKEKNRLRQQLLVRRRLFTARQKTQPDKDYGPEACDPVDIDVLELKNLCKERVLEYQKSPEDIASIEVATVGQHENDLYVTHRSDRLTASQFGMVCKRRNTTPCHNHVKAVLYKKNICTKDMIYGQQNETVARCIFMQQCNKTVRPSGLFIDEEFGFLAASPDGIIEDESAVVEIKCFPSLVRKSQSLETAAKENKSFALQLHNDVLIMNKKHDYYYQVQGQLRISKMQKCYFVCFTSVSTPVTVIDVSRDEEFIRSMMPKLVEFFNNAILPEIILRRVRKNAKCVDLNEIACKL